MLVSNDSLTNLNWLKIQSSPLGKPRGISFDGDEMNLHVPQSYSSSVELQELAAVPYQIISPSFNGALIRLLQDSLLGYYVITGDDIFLDRRDVMNLMMGVPSFSGELPPASKVEGKKEYWTGRQVVSIILPKINVKFKNVVITDGELLKGQINKGASAHIIEVIYNDFGPKICQEYLDNAQNIVTRFLVKHGFSIGVSDIVIKPDLKRQIQDIVVEGKKQVLELERQVHLNILPDVSGNAHSTFENKTLSIINNTTNKINKLYKSHIDPKNRAYSMKEAGSKGNDYNIQQMSTHLGQQKVQGKRVPIGYTDRTLPHYYRYDSDIISRGFVENSFTDGLTPQECFFHAMGGREGLIDTAVKSVSGDTEIILIEDNKPLYTTIGEWIDNKLDTNTDQIQHEKTNNLELLDLTNNVVIPTMDYNGITSWGKVSAVTRHDPGDILYQIKTLGGRSVIVTASKSLLIWNEKLQQFKEIPTPDIQIGDFVPTTANLPEPPVHISLKSLKLNLNTDKKARQLNDIAFDKITEIIEVDPVNYPKMYDLTIPSTYNFGLANGLQVRDTAESGYIQRKLIKAMEDLKVYHDNSVRNANGEIVQFLYGYDSIDASGRIERNRVDLVCDDYATLKENHYFNMAENWQTFMTKSAIKKMMKDKEWFHKSEAYFHNLMNIRDQLYEIFNFTSNDKMEYLKCPFNIERTIHNVIQTNMIRPDQLSDLTPQEVIEEVNTLCDYIEVNGFNNFNFQLVIRTSFSPKKVIKMYRLNKLAFLSAINIIKLKFRTGRVEAGEMVGLLSAQSLGQISTQLTLNSVVGETQLLINEDGVNKVVEIGEWIDAKMKNNRSDIVNIPKNRTQYLELKEHVMIPSCDMDGKTGWHNVSAITKHLPVGDLVKITTNSGRTVTATQAKSFLIYNEEQDKLVQTNGSDIKVGDRIPITYQLENTLETTTHLDLSNYLSKKEWLYGTDYIIAKEHHELCREVCSTIPEKIKLDSTFGFIVGLYLAEGWATDTFIGISNNDPDICKIVYDWCDSISTTYHTVRSKGKNIRCGTSTDIKIHSVTLARLFKKWMGTGSAKKIVPPESYTAPDEFVKGLLDGYISGDGTINLKDGSITASSASEKLLLGVSHLMSRFGIFGKLSSYQAKENNVGSLNIKRTYSLVVRNEFSKHFAKEIGSSHPYKLDRLINVTMKKNYKYPTGRNYQRFENSILDEIKSIEYLPNSTNKFGKNTMINVYDLTVPDTLNFNIYSNACLRDTFHSAGAGATVTTKGVPRLRELISNTRNMSTPSASIFLNEDSKYDLKKALEVKYNIEITTIRDIAVSCAIYNDPDNKFKSVIEEDRNIMEIYKMFHEIDENCREMKSNPWVLRFKFNRQKMMERNISMDNIYQVITHNTISSANPVCIYSDDNSNDLVFRIRLDFAASTEKADDDIKFLKKVENKILDLVVKGTDGISGSNIVEHNISLIKNNMGDYETKSEKILTTDGSNLIDLMNIENVDPTRCYSNDINEINQLFGIEAARTVLYDEFNDIFISEGANYRHIAMLCDIMTNQGIIMSIDRHGINRGTNGPLAKCSFEEAVDQLQQASVHGDMDNMYGVSGNIMVGQISPCGTGDSTLLIDELKLKETQTMKKEEAQIDINEILNDSDYCQENVAIKFNVGKIKQKKVNVANIPKISIED